MQLEQRTADPTEAQLLTVLQQATTNGAVDPFNDASVEAVYSVMLQLLHRYPGAKLRVGEIHSRLSVSFVSMKPMLAPNVVDLLHHVSVATSSGLLNADLQDWLLDCLKNQAPRIDLLARFLLRIKGTLG